MARWWEFRNYKMRWKTKSSISFWQSNSFRPKNQASLFTTIIVDNIKRKRNLWWKSSGNRLNISDGWIIKKDCLKVLSALIKY